MAHPLKLLTANRLDDGTAVWFGAEGRWTGDFSAAHPVSDVAPLEAEAARAVQSGTLCDLAVIDIVQTPRGPEPARLRERIRANGPTVRPDLGKQADVAIAAA